MNILIAGDFRYNSGSSHVVFNYCRAAEIYGCQVKISTEYGSLDSHIGNFIPVCDDISWADHVIFVFEDNQYLRQGQISAIHRVLPRRCITVIDPDGHYGATIHVKNDSNHAKYSRVSWKDLYDKLTDRILQPRLSPLPPGVQFFPYFGMEHGVSEQVEPRDKTYTIQYIGNNWYRWEAVKSFLSQLQVICSSLGRIAIKGKWWDGQTKLGLEDHTHSEVDFLHALGVEIGHSVPFGKVISAMSEAWVSPIFMRPMISAQHLITPRMFETLSADTVPIFSGDEDYIIRLYGPEAQALCFQDNPREKLQDILRNTSGYFNLVQVIQERIYAQYNYDTLVTALLKLIA